MDGVKIFLGGNIGHEASLGTEVAKRESPPPSLSPSSLSPPPLSLC